MALTTTDTTEDGGGHAVRGETGTLLLCQRGMSVGPTVVVHFGCKWFLSPSLQPVHSKLLHGVCTIMKIRK